MDNNLLTIAVVVIILLVALAFLGIIPGLGRSGCCLTRAAVAV